MKYTIHISTKIILAVISIADLIWGSGGSVTVILWVLYGLYKIEN